ncbi:MAG: hypothetical protein ABSC89_01910 [Verrucomicrobiota bacterium]
MNIETKKDNGSGEKREAILYPYTSLAPSLKISDAVKELGGARSPVSKSSLAAHFKESEKSASFLQRIASAKAFGLISGRSDYSLTESAKQYYFPTDESGKSNALLTFLAAPSSFAEVIRRYDGDKLPSREILANVFQRDLKVPESWKERAAAFFENSAQFIGVLDEKRFLRVKAAQHAAESPSTPAHASEPHKTTPRGAMFFGGGQPTFFSDQEEHSLFLDKDKQRKFSINSPLFISRAEYDRICKWIEVTLIVEDEKKP